MAKNTIWFVAVVVVGALIGTFLGKSIALFVPAGSIRDLFATEISAGLKPTVLDLRMIEFTVGCLFRFNIMSVVGIVVAALLFRTVSSGK